MNSLRHRLLFWFLFIAAINIILFVFIAYFYYQRKNRIEKFVEYVDASYVHYINAAIMQQQFLSEDIIKDSFFKTKNSNNVNRYQYHYELLQRNLSAAINHKTNKHFRLQHEFKELQFSMHELNLQFCKIIDLIYIRGFKDWGIEGMLRDYAHKLEDIKSIEPKWVLSLRRHEKDYIIRHDIKYFHKLKTTGKFFNQYLNQYENQNPLMAKEAKNFLSNYLLAVEQMIETDSLIGLTPQDGLKKQLADQKNTIDKKYLMLFNALQEKKSHIYAEMRITLFIAAIVILLMSLLVSLWLSKKITQPAILLANYMNNFVKNNFDETEIPFIESKKDEIGILVKNFSVMRDEIIRNIKYFKEKVNERTAEILKQKKEIEFRNEEIISQKNDLLKQNETIALQKCILEKQNKNLIDSVKFAKMIQDGLLPDENLISEYFPESFLIFKPKDIVSGDIYWFENVYQKNGNLQLFGVIDCTGHGVPGAFMSIMATNLLREAIHDKNVSSPAQVLEHIYKQISVYYRSIGRKQKLSQEIGMEIIICAFNFETHTLNFAGSFIPLYQVRKQEIIIHKTDKIPIGFYNDCNIVQFNNYSIKVEDDDIIYVSTDGFADQFGGSENKKIMSKNFHKLILENANLPMKMQKQTLLNYFDNWKGNQMQTDDVCVLGIHFKFQKDTKENSQQYNKKEILHSL